MAAIIAVFTVAPPKAHAIFGIGDIVFDPAHTFETVAQYLQQLEDYVLQVEGIVNQIKNLESLEDEHWTDAEAALQELAELAGLGESLAFNLPDIDERFKEAFKGIEILIEEGEEAHSAEANMEALKKYSQVGRDTASAALRVAAAANAQVEGEQEALQEILASSQSAEGRLQALQAANQIAAEMVGQQQKMRTLLSAQMQLQAVQAQQQIDKEERLNAARAIERELIKERTEELTQGDGFNLSDR